MSRTTGTISCSYGNGLQRFWDEHVVEIAQALPAIQTDLLAMASRGGTLEEVAKKWKDKSDLLPALLIVSAMAIEASTASARVGPSADVRFDTIVDEEVSKFTAEGHPLDAEIAAAIVQAHP
jgi:hypothetical protein